MSHFQPYAAGMWDILSLDSLMSGIRLPLMPSVIPGVDTRCQAINAGCRTIDAGCQAMRFGYRAAVSDTTWRLDVGCQAIWLRSV